MQDGDAGHIGPAQLLQYDGDEAREEKIRQRDKLRDIVARFENSGLEEFNRRPYEDGRFQLKSTGGSNQKYLDLVNDVHGIDISDLGLEGSGKLDWPQICVVGGQSEGKSTLLSAIVSSKLGKDADGNPLVMKFLPEGTGMVTR